MKNFPIEKKDEALALSFSRSYHIVSSLVGSPNQLVPLQGHI
ncbi:MAG: hypothetical protein PF505_11050 [Vallitaleaceae bacterium]|nr:hypothetical protein [Vallitaleaceae bacterium]